MKILTARDVASANGYANLTTRAWLMRYSAILHDKKVVRFRCNGETMKRYSVHARIDAGRWIADCPICSRSNYVDPSDPIFYCFGCGNQGSGMFVPVLFPDEETRTEIENLLLARPILIDLNDTNPISQAINARAKYKGLGPYWNGEAIAELSADNEKMNEVHDGR
jgi:hypothetical protein